MIDGYICEVCGAQRHRQAFLCHRCKKIYDRVDIKNKPDKKARIKALKTSWDGNNFRCYYTKAILCDNNPKSPLYITYDHKTPRLQSDIVITAACINDMKTDMDEVEFMAMINGLYEVFNGKPIDMNVFKLKHFKR